MNITDIKQILKDQKEDLTKLLKDPKMIVREGMQKYQKMLGSSLIKVVMGPRRSGKSVLCTLLLKDKPLLYVNFDDERFYSMKTQDLNLLLQVAYDLIGEFSFVFLDEIQNIPGWELFVNRLQRKGYNIFITGSNAHLLSHELATHLTGRHLPLQLYPFSFREFLYYHGIHDQKSDFSTKELALIFKHLNVYLHHGGFPEVVRGEDFRQYLLSLYSSILTRDIIARYQIKYVHLLKELGNYLISNFSRKITFQKLKKTFSFRSVHTVQNYCSYMEETFLIFFLERFSFKKKERSIAPRKLYVIDTGFIEALSTPLSKDLGHIYENAVAIELMRKKIKNPRLHVCYFEEDGQYEVDFVIIDQKKIKHLIQVCFNIEDHETKEREIRALIKAKERLKCNNLTIITENIDAQEQVKGACISIIPLWKWLLMD